MNQQTIAYATQAAVDQALNYAEEMLIELGAHDTIQALFELPQQIMGAQQQVLRLRSAVDSLKRGAISQAKEALDVAILIASEEAPRDGKNAEERKRQIDLFLAQDSQVKQAKANLYKAEGQLAMAEDQLAQAEVSLDALRSKFRAALCTGGLQEAVIRATAVRQ